MNFVDYCIATRNYSTIAAIKDYVNVKTFAEKKSGKGAKIAAAALGTAALASGAGNVHQYLKNLDLQGVADERAIKNAVLQAQLADKDKRIDAIIDKANADQKKLNDEFAEYIRRHNNVKLTDEAQKNINDLQSASEEDIEQASDDAAATNGFSKKFSYYNNLINQYNSYKNRKRR